MHPVKKRAVRMVLIILAIIVVLCGPYIDDQCPQLERLWPVGSIQSSGVSKLPREVQLGPAEVQGSWG
uniref:Uncharacterized protein n=1 Tax=Knipowitschia caucasica TaxID=637954 RepID=A0AAV2LEB9_KNICA